jgi:hypothetical protein
VVLMALPGARTRCEPPLSMKPPVSVPEIVSLPPDKCEPLPDPPLLIVRKPPELTVVALATPAESTNIEPPLTTTSPESVWPDDLVRREIPWLTITLMRGPQLFLSFYLERIGRPILSASGTAGI